MKRTNLFILATVAVLVAGAEAPNGSGTYYQNADGKTGAQLKTALCGIIYNRTEQTYGSLWTAFYSTDVRAGGENKLWDMYSNKTPYLTLGTNQDTGSGNAEGQYYNREHSFPQSWFGSNTPMYTDLHHIYPTDKFVNGKRSNYPFGETDGEDYKSANNFSKLGACTYSGYSGKVFEPNDEYKGDFARTYFYMVTCYEEKLADWYAGNADGVRATINGTTYPAFQTWQLNMLMAWATSDPVSEKEINRNNAVAGIQGNRNPFIDYPGLEQYIWGNKTDVAFDYDDYDGSSSGSGEGGGGEGDLAGTYKLTITKDDFNTTSYNANNNEKTSLAVCTTDASKTFEVKWTSNQIYQNSSKMQWQKGAGYIYNSTDLGTIESVTISSTSGTFTTYYGIEEAPSESTEVGGGYFKTVVGSDVLGLTTKVEVVFTIAGGSTPVDDPEEGGYFTKITSMSDFEDGGTYLIVYETGSKAFNGALDTLDVANNCVSVTIEDYKIAATPDVMSATFTIASKTGGYSIKSASERYIGNTSDANGLKRSAEDKYTSDLYFGKADGNVYIQSSSSYLRYNSGASENRFRYFKSSSYTQQKAIQLYKYIAPAVAPQTVVVSSAGYATMVAAADVEIPAGVEAFAVQISNENTYAHLEPITNAIPAGEAVLIRAAEGTYNFATASGQVNAIEGNDLVPAKTDKVADGLQYCLAHRNDAVGFYQVEAGVTIPAGKAYLVVPSSSGLVKPFIGFEDEETGIEETLSNSPLKGENIYNVAGQKVNGKSLNGKLPKGIYIVNGKKILF